MSPEDILAQHDHRPFPLPRRPWIMRQTWNRLLFAHWAVNPESLRRLVPPVLEIDIRDGRCWVAVTPFFLSGLRPRGLPPVAGVSSFPELNVRTYVTYEGVPGVYFFSLDAGSVMAVFGARSAYGLPYFYARISEIHDGDVVRYHCRRRHLGKVAEFRGEYQPRGPVFDAAPGSLERFLVERYCLYSVQGRRLYRAHIHHVPWPLHLAEASITTNTMAAAADIDVPDGPPLLHYAREIEVLVWAPERLR